MKQLQVQRKLMDLEYIRVTSWRLFEECPYTWAQQYLCGVSQEQSNLFNEANLTVRTIVQQLRKIAQRKKHAASHVGTAVHLIMENFQLSVFGDNMQVHTLYQNDYLNDATEEDKLEMSTLLWSIIPESEVSPLYEYMDKYTELQEKGYMLMALEEELETTIPGIPVPIRGHLDARWLTPTAATMIDDHKTNRSFDGVDFWKEQLQQMLYAYMVRQNNRRLIMRIGYPNHGRHVEWETDPSDDDRLVARIQKNWNKMLQYEEEGVWPRRINDKCKWCPIRTLCPDYEMVVHNFAQSFERRVFPLSIGEQLEFVQSVKSIVEAKEEELKAQIAEEVIKAGGSVKFGDKIWRLETGERRAISAETVMRVISAQVAAVPELGPIAISRMDDVFTAKVGGIDKLIKDTGAFGSLKDYIVKKPNAAPTLKSVPAGKLLTGK